MAPHVAVSPNASVANPNLSVPSSNIASAELPYVDGPPEFSVEENPFLHPLMLFHDQGTPVRESIASGEAPTESAASWWLLHTKPRQEKKLAEQLGRFNIPHYLPVVKCKALTRGRARITLSPLFPSYFFLYGTPDQRLQALETNRIVASHNVDDGEGLRRRLLSLARLIEKGEPLTSEARLVEGRQVRVKSGSFQGMEGTVIKRGGKTRLFIEVNQLLGGVSLAIEEHMLEPLF